MPGNRRVVFHPTAYGRIARYRGRSFYHPGPYSSGRRFNTRARANWRILRGRMSEYAPIGQAMRRARVRKMLNVFRRGVRERVMEKRIAKKLYWRVLNRRFLDKYAGKRRRYLK